MKNIQSKIQNLERAIYYIFAMESEYLDSKDEYNSPHRLAANRIRIQIGELIDAIKNDNKS